MKKFLAIFIAMFVLTPILSLAIISSAQAAEIPGGGWGTNAAGGTYTADTLAGQAGLNTTDPRQIAAKVVNVILGFLGIIAVVLILVGGFMWMTSAGSEEKTGTAKKIMTAGVIGLVIVLAAFGIAKFVVSALITATT